MRRLFASLLTLFTITFALGWTTPCQAQTPSVESIRHFMEKGQGLFAGGNYVHAAEVFEAGFDLYPYSAFLFNAGVALEKADRQEEALKRFKRYIQVDPGAPDKAEVESRITRLQTDIEAKKHASATPGSSPAPRPVGAPAGSMQTKSLVVLETDPPVAPVRLYRQVSGKDAYRPNRPNPGWGEVIQTHSPANLSLDTGRYYAYVEKFDDYNESGTEFDVQPGRVVQVMVSLSQGEFMAYLRVTSNVPEAKVYVDDPNHRAQAWGKAPHGELVTAGKHTLVVEATGYQPRERKVELERGKQYDLRVDLERVNFGTLRIDSNAPSIAVEVDGRSVGTWTAGALPLDVPNLSAGAHRLRVTSDDRKDVETEIMIPRGQVLPLNALMVVTPPRGAAWTQAIVASVLLGGGIYAGLESNRIYDDLSADRRRGVLEGDDKRITYGQIYAVGADVAFLGSAVLAGLATYNFLDDPLPPSRVAAEPALEFDAPRQLSRALQKLKAKPLIPAKTGRLRRPDGWNRNAPINQGADL